MNRPVLSWAFYDWANSAYAVTVMSGFFPLFFKQYWADSLSAQESTYQLGLANSVASLAIVVLAPILGSIADCAGSKKKFLFVFTFLGVTMCASLFLLEQGSWQLAIAIYIFACIGFMGGVSFSDSLLVDVSPKKDFDKSSALGYALGYLGGGILFAVCVWMVQTPALFGITSVEQAVKLSFLLVALWWLVFSIPVFLWVRESPATAAAHSAVNSLWAGFLQLRQTFRQIKELKVVFTFLLAYWLYIDGVDTIVRMAVDYGLSLGIDSNDLIIALLITQFIGFPSAIAFGYLGEKIGPKAGIMIAIGVYIFVTFWAYQMDSSREFYILAIIIGMVQGGVQSLSRSLYARIIPKHQSAEFFGFYNMLGKFAAVLGPVMIGWVTVMTGNHRLAMLSILILFIAGAVILIRVNIAEGIAHAEKIDKQYANLGSSI
jgi:UMF1 family MFS transporter